MAENLNLKKTIILPDPSDATQTKEFNINAVYSDVAGKVTTPLVIKESGEVAGAYNGDATGENAKTEINYVSADGGKFTNKVLIDNKHGNFIGGIEDSEIINYGQIKTALSQLNGAPLYKWEADYDTDRYDFTEVENLSGTPYKLNVVVGRSENLQFFKEYADGKKIDKKYIPDGANYLTYSEVIDENSTITGYEVTGITDSASTFTEIVIPEKHDDKPILRLADSIFANNTNIQKVYISKGITAIGQGTFEGCVNLSYIAIPDSITTMEYGLFEGCASLTEVDLSRELIEIPQAAFYGCSALEKIIIGNKVTTIYSSAFAECPVLKDIYFTGTKAEWDNITIIDDEEIIGAGLKSKLDSELVTIHYGNMPFPFLYICKDGDGDTSLTSNKMFLKLPGEDVVEISKGAVRLEKPDSQANYGYYTYDTLAAIIAGINTRLKALGSDTLELPSVLPETSQVLIPDTIISEEILQVPEDIPTVQELKIAIDNVANSLNAEQGIVREGSTFKLAQDFYDYLVTQLYGQPPTIHHYDVAARAYFLGTSLQAPEFDENPTYEIGTEFTVYSLWHSQTNPDLIEDVLTLSVTEQYPDGTTKTSIIDEHIPKNPTPKSGIHYNLPQAFLIKPEKECKLTFTLSAPYTIGGDRLIATKKEGCLIYCPVYCGAIKNSTPSTDDIDLSSLKKYPYFGRKDESIGHMATYTYSDIKTDEENKHIIFLSTGELTLYNNNKNPIIPGITGTVNIDVNGCVIPYNYAVIQNCVPATHGIYINL